MCSTGVSCFSMLEPVEDFKVKSAGPGATYERLRQARLQIRTSSKLSYQYASEGCSLRTFVGRVGSFFKSARVLSSLKRKTEKL